MAEALAPENIWAPAARAGPPLGLQLVGRRWPSGLCPPRVAYTNFTPSLGVTGPHGEGRCSQQPLGNTGGLLSQHWCPLASARNTGCYLPTLGSQGGLARKLCPAPFPSPVSPKQGQHRGHWPWSGFFNTLRGTKCGTQLMGSHKVARASWPGTRGLCKVGEPGSDSSSAASIRHFMA